MFPANITSYSNVQSGGIKYFYTVTSLDRCGNESGEEGFQKSLPAQSIPIALHSYEGVLPSQNYPEPFSDTTCIAYEVPVQCAVTIQAFQQPNEKTLFSGTVLPGAHIMMIDGSSFASGQVEFRLFVGDTVVTKMMVKK